MTIYVFAGVLHILSKYHEAEIRYSIDVDGPIAWTLIDGKLDEGVQANDGMTMKRAYYNALRTLHLLDYFDDKYKKMRQ